MCGIAGKVAFDGAADRAVIEQMCAAIEHRGPDSRGVYVDGGVSLGIQRLAIVDIAGGDQPIYNEDGSVVVVMNGEIYNYRELQDELHRGGHQFQTASDTEVLVHLYEEHGDSMVEHLHGMFAFALWDVKRRRLLCARDRAGKKPLFWTRRGATVWFASELAALLADPSVPRTVNSQAIGAYLALKYVPHPLCAFEGIHKLPPASTLACTPAGDEVRRYWQLDYARKHVGVSEPELVERLRGLIRDATRRRLIGEAPLGAFLSGGIDSSAVVAAMAEVMTEPVKTFSIGFGHADYDELSYARMIAERFGTEHHEFQVEPKALEIMPKLARHYGEPYADPSAIPSFYLAEMTSRHVTVALNGDGGDESFAGYRRYAGINMVQRFDGLPSSLKAVVSEMGRRLPPGSSPQSVLARVRRMSQTIALPPEQRYAYWMSVFPAALRRELLTSEFSAAATVSPPDGALLEAWHGARADNQLDRMLATDVGTYLPDDLLVKVDIATMAYSLEARSPLLDHELMEFAAALPVDLKTHGGDGKILLKRALRGTVPDEILDRPKQGFNVPLAEWFRGELRSLPAEVLLDPGSLARGYFRREGIERLISEHQAGEADHAVQLWSLLQLETWHQQVADVAPPHSSLASRGDTAI
ncbi:MAG: asparagine synthase (glutamine-hydrolyzing) [Solirubrobacteraceae bacterium]